MILEKIDSPFDSHVESEKEICYKDHMDEDENDKGPCFDKPHEEIYEEVVEEEKKPLFDEPLEVVQEDLVEEEEHREATLYPRCPTKDKKCPLIIKETCVYDAPKFMEEELKLEKELYHSPSATPWFQGQEAHVPFGCLFLKIEKNYEHEALCALSPRIIYHVYLTILWPFDRGAKPDGLMSACPFSKTQENTTLIPLQPSYLHLHIVSHSQYSSLALHETALYNFSLQVTIHLHKPNEPPPLHLSSTTHLKIGNLEYESLHGWLLLVKEKTEPHFPPHLVPLAFIKATTFTLSHAPYKERCTPCQVEGKNTPQMVVFLALLFKAKTHELEPYQGIQLFCPRETKTPCPHSYLAYSYEDPSFVNSNKTAHDFTIPKTPSYKDCLLPSPSQTLSNHSNQNLEDVAQGRNGEKKPTDVETRVSSKAPSRIKPWFYELLQGSTVNVRKMSMRVA